MSVEVTLVQRLTVAQRVAVAGLALTLRTGLLGDLWDERWRVEGGCPKCSRKLTALEIVRGFNNDPRDYTTACSGCGKRFEPKLIASTNSTKLELPFFCALQTLDQLSGCETIAPDELRRRLPAVYRSAMFHYGNIARAFAELGLTYAFPELPAWKEKVVPYLGRMTDKSIAEIVGASPREVSLLRREHGIEHYTKSRALSEADLN